MRLHNSEAALDLVKFVVGCEQILGGVIFTVVSGLGTLGATYGNTDFGSSMALLAVTMNIIGSVWFFLILLVLIYVAACALLKKQFATES